MSGAPDSNVYAAKQNLTTVLMSLVVSAGQYLRTVGVGFTISPSISAPYSEGLNGVNRLATKGEKYN